MILLNALPVIVMIVLIPVFANDYLLTLIYLIIIVISLTTKCDHRDITVLVFGFLIMVVSEFFFINTGVERFNRQTLFGVMPIWLPFLWAYGFVAIKRSIKILEE